MAFPFDRKDKPEQHITIGLGAAAISMLLGYGAGDLLAKTFQHGGQVAEALPMALGSIAGAAAMWIFLWKYDPSGSMPSGRYIAPHAGLRIIALFFALMFTVPAGLFGTRLITALTYDSATAKQAPKLVAQARGSMTNDDWTQGTRSDASPVALARAVVRMTGWAQQPKGVYDSAVQYAVQPKLSKDQQHETVANIEAYHAFAHLTDAHAVVVLHVPNFGKLSDADSSSFQEGVIKVIDWTLRSSAVQPRVLSLVIHDESGFRKPRTVDLWKSAGDSNSDRVKELADAPAGEAGLGRIFEILSYDNPYQDAYRLGATYIDRATLLKLPPVPIQ